MTVPEAGRGHYWDLGGLDMVHSWPSRWKSCCENLSYLANLYLHAAKSVCSSIEISIVVIIFRLWNIGPEPLQMVRTPVQNQRLLTQNLNLTQGMWAGNAKVIFTNWCHESPNILKTFNTSPSPIMSWAAIDSPRRSNLLFSRQHCRRSSFSFSLWASTSAESEEESAAIVSESRGAASRSKVEVEWAY